MMHNNCYWVCLEVYQNTSTKTMRNYFWVKKYKFLWGTFVDLPKHI